MSQNDVGPPDHVPFVPVTVCPTCAVPLSTGNPVFVGGATDAACTTAVAALSAIDGPEAFVAVTRARIVEPWSAPTST